MNYWSAATAAILMGWCAVGSADDQVYNFPGWQLTISPGPVAAKSRGSGIPLSARTAAPALAPVPTPPAPPVEPTPAAAPLSMRRRPLSWRTLPLSSGVVPASLSAEDLPAGDAAVIEIPAAPIALEPAAPAAATPLPAPTEPVPAVTPTPTPIAAPAEAATATTPEPRVFAGPPPPNYHCGTVSPGVNVDPLWLAQQYQAIHDAIPFYRSEYDTNPNYRHDAAMEFLFGQMRPTVVQRSRTDVYQHPQEYFWYDFGRRPLGLGFPGYYRGWGNY